MEIPRHSLAGEAACRLIHLQAANAALQKALDSLSERKSLRTAVDALSQSLLLSLGAQAVLVFLCPHEALRSVRETDGASIEIPTDGESRDTPYTLHSSTSATASALVESFDRLLTLGRSAVHCTTDPEVFDESDQRRLASTGVRHVLHLPVKAGDTSLGAVVVMFSNQARLSNECLEHARSLVLRMAMVIQLDRRSAGAVALAVECERARIAREMHDGVAQSFISIEMKLRQPAERQNSETQEVIALAAQGLVEVRRAIAALRPHALLNRPFTEALESMARTVVGRSVRLSVNLTGRWRNLPADQEAHLFRIVQESLNNATRHSCASVVSVDIVCTDVDRSILVVDNGVGFDAKAVDGAGFGRSTMLQRASAIGASIATISSHGKGTEVMVSLMA